MEIPHLDLINMVDYWEAQRMHAETALKYAKEQVTYWSGKLAIAQDVEMVLKDGS